MPLPPIYALAAATLAQRQAGGLPPGWGMQPSAMGGVDLAPGAPQPPRVLPGRGGAGGQAQTVVPSLPLPDNAGSMVRPVSPTDAVPMEQQMTPDERIAQAFDVAGYPPPEPAQQAPASAPASDQAGAGGMLSRLTDPLTAAIAGLSGVRSTSSPLIAAAQGAGGALSFAADRQARKSELAAKAEERQYQRSRDQTKDTQWEQEFGLKQTEAEREASREGRQDQLSEIKTLADIQKTLADTRRIEREARLQGITPMQVLEINRQALEFGKQLIAGRPLIRDAARAAIEQQVKDYKKALTSEVKATVQPSGESGPGTAPAPAQQQPGGTSVVPKSQPGVTGEGSYDAPYQFSGTPEEIRAQAETLPQGAYYIDPATGVTYRKR